MNPEQIKTWIKKANDRIQQRKDELSELDQAIGDGDHGTNMARGFGEACSAVANKDDEDCGAVLQDVSMTLISKVGGASGPLFGTAFMKMAAAAKGKKELSTTDWSQLLQEAADGIKMRGKAETGQKTMLDVWQPAAEYLAEYSEQVSGEAFKDFCKEKMEATKDMQAQAGRASYLGERSIGHIDPGAASSYELFAALAESEGFA